MLKQTKMIKTFHLTALLFFFISCQTSAQTTELLSQKIEQIISAKNAIVGAAINR